VDNVLDFGILIHIKWILFIEINVFHMFHVYHVYHVSHSRYMILELELDYNADCSPCTRYLFTSFRIEINWAFCISKARHHGHFLK